MHQLTPSLSSQGPRADERDDEESPCGKMSNTAIEFDIDQNHSEGARKNPMCHDAVPVLCVPEPDQTGGRAFSQSVVVARTRVV